MIDFPGFLEHVRGREPYPWQTRFAVRAAEAVPHRAVVVPTGAGKTTVLDALVWALASQSERPAAERTVGVRMIWAIDRRILVDQVAEAAQDLANLLIDAEFEEAHPLSDVARRLQALKGAHCVGPPLLVTRWRGGIDLGAAAQHPMQAEIITSTVAQVGSRLLFRGYGLGDSSLPIGAALTACDATICVDEAHIAEPFAETLEAVRLRREAESVALPGLATIRLSATPGPESGDDVLDLSADDEAQLAQRLQAPKLIRLVEPGSTADADQETALLDALTSHLDDGARVLACVCNSVRVARAVYDRLAKQRTDADTVLLIGPQRPADRERLFQQKTSGLGPILPTVGDVLFKHQVSQRPLIVVATQTIEVGLDLDVDAMVLQSASASSIVQRLGRLNRRGLGVGRATIVRHTEFPLYELDEPAAWEWLRGFTAADDDTIDLSIAALRASPAPPNHAVERAPELTDMVVELLGATSPRPHAMADPDVEVYLRGIGSEPASDIQLCWRDDLRPDADDEAGDAYRAALIRNAPLVPAEIIGLDIAAAKNLLSVLVGDRTAGKAALDKQVLGPADVEGASVAEMSGSGSAFEDDEIRFFVFRGISRDGVDLQLGRATADSHPQRPGLRVSDLRPGDTVILPRSMGGVDEVGLAPKAGPPDSLRSNDVGDDVRGAPSERVRVRLTAPALRAALASGSNSGGSERAITAILGAARKAHREDGGIADLLASLNGHPCIDQLSEDAELRQLHDYEDADTEVAVVFGDEPPEADSLGAQDASLFAGESSPTVASPLEGWVLLGASAANGSTDDRSRPQPPTLETHADAVAERVAAFAQASGLPTNVEKALRLAGLTHDHGKADPRMQAFFQGGVASLTQPLLAKSVFGTFDVAAARRARAASGWPRGLRHEIASAQILSQAIESGMVPTELEDADSALAVRLVLAHHGRAHPIPPVPVDTVDPARFAVSLHGVSGSATGDGTESWTTGQWFRDRGALIERYGAWGLAYLEALLMLADRTVSAEGG